jgi:hypothetical protein
MQEGGGGSEGGKRTYTNEHPLAKENANNNLHFCSFPFNVKRGVSHYVQIKIIIVRCPYEELEYMLSIYVLWVYF